MKKTIGLVLIAALLLFAAGCKGSGGSDAPVTIRFIEAQTQSAPAAQPVLAKFIEEAGKRGIIVEHTTGNGDDLRTKIRAEFAAGNPPDLFSWNVGANFKELVDADALLEVNEFFQNSTKFKKDTWVDDAWSAVTLDGGQHLWGLPTGAQYMALIANKDLFDKYNLKYPKTYSELLQVAEVFKANGIFAFGQGSKNGNPSHFTFDSIMHQFIPLDYAKGFFAGTAKFDMPGIVLAAKYCQEMQQKGVFTNDPMANGDWSVNAELFNTGRSAMITVHPWTVASIDTENINYELIDWWTYPETTVDPNSYYVGGTNNCIVIAKSAYADEKKRPAIQETAEFFLGDEMVQAFIANGVISPRRQYNFELANYLKGLTFDVVSFLQNRQSVFYLWGSLPDGATAAAYQTEFADALWAGTDTPENLVKHMQSLMDTAYTR